MHANPHLHHHDTGFVLTWWGWCACGVVEATLLLSQGAVSPHPLCMKQGKGVRNKEKEKDSDAPVPRLRHCRRYRMSSPIGVPTYLRSDCPHCTQPVVHVFASSV